MRKNNIRIPSTKALLALEATVRLGTATLAAQELGLTQAAVSHRIHDLEADLGLTLFVRNGRRLQPTADALSLADAVQRGHDLIATVIRHIQNKPTRSSLTISMLPALASKWFAPHLASILNDLKHADLRVTASRDFVDFERDDVDVAIRFGRGHWAETRSQKLAHEVVTPVMSPELAARLDVTAKNPLEPFTLLECDNPESWSDWFMHTGLKTSDTRKMLYFDEDAAMLEATISGNGVALGRSVLVAHDIRAGRLVAPFKESLISDFSYWYVQDSTALEIEITKDFFQWARRALGEDSKIFDRSKD